MVTIQELPQSSMARLGEIDRSEEVHLGYTCRDGKLLAEEVNWRVPPWLAEGEGSHSLKAMTRFCDQILAQGGVLLGALDGEKLVGVAIVRFHLTETMAQLAFLHVSRPYRRQGIAARLTAEVVKLARREGARSLYVSATPSESAVGFYLSQGFRPVRVPHPELLALEPEDIHMTRHLW